MYEELVKRLRTAQKLAEFAAEDVAKMPNMIFGEAADAIEELSKPRWIPVSEKKPPLPKDEDVCFVDVIAAIRGRKESAQVKYCRAYRWYRDGKRECIERFIDDWEVVDVTHWMPMPTPPKEEGPNFCEDCGRYSAEREYCSRYECHAYNATRCVNWEPKGNAEAEPPKEEA